jgi:PIN domain nuclease of toxin-antitoxin system
MKLLLDTHAIVWWLVNSRKLSDRARAVIADPANTIYISAASAWEIATKVRLGKWPEAAALVGAFDAIMEANGFEALAISVHHAIHAGTLHAAHPDPFDRMLAAQAELEGVDLVTADPAFAEFDVRTIW